MAAHNSGRAIGRPGRAGGNRGHPRSPRASTEGEGGAVSQTARRKRIGGLPDSFPILGRLSDALSMIVVAHRAIDDQASDPDAAIVLAQGSAVLKAVYDEIDIAEGQLCSLRLASGRSS